MIVTREHVQQLKEAGYTYHELAEIAKCPTPAVMQLGKYGTQPDKAIDLDVAKLLKAKQAQSGAVEEVKIEEKPKMEGKR